jgi:hypothetical protein
LVDVSESREVWGAGMLASGQGHELLGSRGRLQDAVESTVRRGVFKGSGWVTTLYGVVVVE